MPRFLIAIAVSAVAACLVTAAPARAQTEPSPPAADDKAPRPPDFKGVGPRAGSGGRAAPLSPEDEACQRSLQQLLAEAEKGDARSAYRVAVIYDSGCGVRRDPSVAAAYYELAGKNGLEEGNVRLGMIYIDGGPLGKDFAKARKLLEPAAAKNHPFANFYLGVIAQNGGAKGEGKDLVLAQKYFEAAAKAGHPDGQFVAGYALLSGDNTRRDPAAAKDYLTRAANQGHPASQAVLGRLHAEGELPGADPLEAYKWLSIVLRDGGDELLNAMARTNLDKLKAKLTQAQRASAEARIKAYKPKIEWEEKI